MNMAGTARPKGVGMRTTRPDLSAVPCHALTTVFAMNHKVLAYNQKTCENKSDMAMNRCFFWGQKPGVGLPLIPEPPRSSGLRAAPNNLDPDG
jgi:hypothetical protein